MGLRLSNYYLPSPLQSPSPCSNQPPAPGSGDRDRNNNDSKRQQICFHWPSSSLSVGEPATPGRQVIPSNRSTSSLVARSPANSPRHRTISMQHTRASNASSLPIASAITPRGNLEYSPAYAASILFFASKYSRRATGLLFFTAPVSSRVYISTTSGPVFLPEKEADSNGQTRNPA